VSRVGVMRCLSCGAEMREVGVVHDESAGAAGYVRQTLQCSGCQEVETRTTLQRAAAFAAAPNKPQASASPVSASRAPLTAPYASGSPSLDIAAAPSAAPTGPGEPMPADPFDAAELLLQRAIEMVRGPVHGTQSPKGLTEGLSAEPIEERSDAPTVAPSQGFVAAAPPPAAEPVAQPAAPAENEIDEGELLLKRAIAMVRGAAHDRPAAGIAAPAPPARPARPRKAPPGRIVRICHDPNFDPVYAAQDTTSGLVMIRHQDSTRLRAMCERLGWQVVESDAP
jgi:hypothetical protein